MIRAALGLAALALAPLASAVTIYTSLPGSIPTQLAGKLADFDPVQMNPPAPVSGPTAISVTLPTGAVSGLSKPQRPDFVGVSLELSVTPTIIGRNGTFINPIFLNHIQNLRARSGALSIRVGGNSQEKVTLVPTLPNGLSLNKTVDAIAQARNLSTPLLTLSYDLFYAMSNISSLVGVGWYFGLPFLNPSQISNVATMASTILGSNLLGLQLANEPDQYLVNGNVQGTWSIPTYMTLWNSIRSQYVGSRTDLIAPNVCCSFRIGDVLAAGFLGQFGQYLQFVAVQHYKDSACTNSNTSVTGTQAFTSYITHAAAQGFMAEYANASTIIAASGKDFVLLETNTASCGGFPGASDSYGAALYLIDLALQAASIGFSQLLIHNGGPGQFYNLFSPPPSNESTFRQWTTTPPYYSALIMAEAMSESGSQVKDLLLNNNSTVNAGYAIYKNGNPIRLALFNYNTDSSGASDITVNVAIQSASPPSSVQVKYFSSATGSTGDKFNLTWAGQTMGGEFGSDGRLQGTEQVITISCSSGVCAIPVKAPQFALVLLDGANPISNPAAATETFATSVLTKLPGGGTVYVLPQVLETSNGRGGAQEIFNLGGTSFGKSQHSGAMALKAALGTVLVGAITGVVLLTGWAKW